MSSVVSKIARDSDLPEAKVTEVFRRISESIRSEILDGNEFRFGDLGRFFIEVGSSPTARVVFVPSNKLVKEVETNFVENRNISV